MPKVIKKIKSEERNITRSVTISTPSIQIQIQSESPKDTLDDIIQKAEEVIMKKLNNKWEEDK
jgi:hypothetical protein